MEKRYNTYGEMLKERFGLEKIFKVPIDAGFTCPNRDGKCGTGGCTFCSSTGSGDAMVTHTRDLVEQFETQVARLKLKWPKAHKYIVYFQSFTNTYGDIAVIRERYEAIINHPDVIGISIGTRPDCLADDVLEYLAELNKRFYLWVELGLQTTNDETSRRVNRGHDYQVYVEAAAKLRALDINVCVHLINGLPGEDHEQMVENVRRVVADSDIQGIKLHLLHLIKGSRIIDDYERGELKLMPRVDYVKLVCDQLEIIPKNIIIHRLTGDAPRDILVGPMWSLKKFEIMNAIDTELARRGTCQGSGFL
ncbi:MAG: TIGR01212 family radical SAM protein [Lactobacillales bacterium]|jgi:radical SAM protein (TIGR01212 family)|nr:TIGR01212 family radical SAM protein [Lactobacillales bacterium]